MQLPRVPSPTIWYRAHPRLSQSKRNIIYFTYHFKHFKFSTFDSWGPTKHNNTLFCDNYINILVLYFYYFMTTLKQMKTIIMLSTNVSKKKKVWHLTNKNIIKNYYLWFFWFVLQDCLKMNTCYKNIMWKQI